MSDEDLEFKRGTMFRENIYVFDCFTVGIFSELYKRFPVKTNINGHEAVVKCKYKNDDKLEELEKMIILKSTFEWLRDNDFIKYDGEVDEGVGIAYNCILTNKGLNALEKIPKSINNKKSTIGQKIISEIVTCSTEAGIALVKQAILG